MPAQPPRLPPGNTLRHLEQLIEGLSAGVLLMDTAGVLIWANGAALAMHGVRSVEELGANADDYARRFSLRFRNGHQLRAREYPLLRVLAGESFPDLTVEVTPAGGGKPRWVHHVRDVVMDGDDGEPDCYALVLQDVSERFEAEERFEAMFQANPAPALILRLADQRFIRANRGFFDLTGYARADLIGRSLFDMDLLRGAARLPLVKERLEAGATIPQMEAELPLPDGGAKLVILAGQPIEVADEPCMLFTFADLEPRRRAERALERSERHFAALFRMAPVAMALTSADGHRVIEANQAFARLFGQEPSRSAGRGAGELNLWADPADREAMEAEVARGGGVRNRDARLVGHGGEPVSALISAERIELKGERCTLWLFQDITERRHTELELADAIEAVMKDARWFSRSIMDKLVALRHPDREPAEPSDAAAALTRREREVLELIAEGMDDRAIAERLDLSANTVRNHVARIYAKTGVNRRGAAVVWAREHGVGLAAAR